MGRTLPKETLAPSEEGAGLPAQRDGKTEGEITPICVLQTRCAGDGGAQVLRFVFGTASVRRDGQRYLSLRHPRLRLGCHLPPQREASGQSVILSGATP